MVNTPIPMNLKSEAKKAARILQDFTMPDSKVGFDRIIPAKLIFDCKGLAIITVVKLGFLVTARGGSGVVIARLSNGSWSAPSAIGIAGLGGGFEIGAEVTDFVIVLNSESAVQAFSKGGNMTIGGNLSVAVGPLGRNMEGDVSVRSPAAMYTYSRTKGLFAGISIEGSGLIERKDANKKFYGYEVRAYQILTGEVQQPPDCGMLYDVLKKHETLVTSMMKRKVAKTGKNVIAQGFSAMRSSMRGKKSGKQSPDINDSVAIQSRPYSSVRRSSMKSNAPPPPGKSGISHSQSMRFPQRPQAPPVRKTSVPSSGFNMVQFQPTQREQSSTVWVKACWSYDAQLPCDLTFKEGDMIEVLTRTSTQNDWWEGSIYGEKGIFPANYTEIIQSTGFDHF